MSTTFDMPEGAGRCAKQIVTATVVAPNGDRFIATNYTLNPQVRCPRADMPTGVGYHLCKEVCEQPGHAEINALKLAGDKAMGATLNISGHTYACESCKQAARDAGIKKIVFT